MELNSALLHLFCAFEAVKWMGLHQQSMATVIFFSHDAVITSSALNIKHSNNTSMAGLEWVNEYPVKRKGIEAKYLQLEEEHFIFLGQKATNCSQLIAYEYQGLTA